MDLSKTASIFGSTGLVGTALVEILAEDKRYTSINLANRTAKNPKSAKLKEVIVDYNSLAHYPELFQVDEVYVCLGTTIKKAGSQKKFEEVDLELPIKIAQLAKAANVSSIIVITAIGANAKSSNFYLKTKGRVQNEIAKLAFKNYYFVQPSLLMGDRIEKRTAEGIAMWWMKKLDFLFFGPLKKYGGIYDHEVAKAMVQLANTETKKHIYQSDELKKLSIEYENNHEHT